MYIFKHPFQVNQLIDEETKRYRGSKKYLEHLPPVVYDKFLVGFWVIVISDLLPFLKIFKIIFSINISSRLSSACIHFETKLHFWHVDSCTEE